MVSSLSSIDFLLNSYMAGLDWAGLGCRDIAFLVRVPKSETYRKTQDIQSVFNCLSVTSLPSL